jgi:hypothetical protein
MTSLNLSFIAMRSITFLSIILSLVFYSCEECGIDGEPTLKVIYPSQDTLSLKSIKAIGSLSPIPKEGIASYQQSGVITLPFNLTADSTTYIFEQQTKTDTLTVFYKKTVVNVSKKCGYIIDIVRPENNKEVESTFEDVYVSYIPYYNNTKGIQSSGGEGVIVQIIKL